MTTTLAIRTKFLWAELCLILQRGRQVWHMVPRKQRIALGAAALLMTLSSMAGIGIPLLLGNLIDSLQRGTNNGVPAAELTSLCLLTLVAIAGLVLARECLHVVRRYLVENTCTGLDKHLNIRLVSHLLRIDLGSLTHEKVGALNGRISRSIDGFMRFLRISFLDFFPAIITGLMAITATMSKQPYMALAMVGVIPISLMLTAWQLMTQKGVRLHLMRCREELDGTVVEQLGGIDYVRAANTLPHEVERIARAAEQRRKTELRHHFEMSLFGCAKALTEGFFYILVVGSAIYLAMLGTIGFGDVLTFSILFMSVMTPLAEIHRVMDDGHEASLRVGDLIDLLHQPLDRSFVMAAAGDGRFDAEAPLLEIEGLQADYRYSDGRMAPALRDVSLTVTAGETIGVAGCSGSGKSTWLKVLLRLVHPKAGQVRVQGVPIDQLSREQVSQLFGYVGQTPFVFSGTISENIGYGCGPTTAEDILRAARQACLHEEIMALPDGYNTKVAERGQNLSGGQRQRLALARVFLKNPPILILDEATSALDNINERKVQRALEAARADRTVIQVAHRLSTFADVDRIVVFQDGRIVEAGTYDELLDQDGSFAELVRHSERDSEVPQGEAMAVQ